MTTEISSSETIKPGASRNAGYIVTPHRRMFSIDLGELWRYKDLLPLLLRRDLRSEFSQTMLGPLWFVLHPVLQSVVFSLIFGRLGKMSTDGAPAFLFYNAGLVFWTFFTTTMTYVSNVFITNAGLFGKIYFPRMIVPISITMFRSINFVTNYAIFLALFLYFLYSGSALSWNAWVLATPILVIQVALLAFGIGTLASAFTTRYRDLVQAFGYLTSVWMYATPVIYPISSVPERWQWVFYFNPMSSVVEIFRHAYLGSGDVNLELWAVNFATTILLFFAGIYSFNYSEKSMIDTI